MLVHLLMPAFAVSVLCAAAVVGLSVLASALAPGDGSLGMLMLRGTLALGIGCCLWLTGPFWRSSR